MIKINYTITKDDCKDYAKYLYNVPKIKKMMNKTYGLMFLTIGICLAVCLFASFPDYSLHSIMKGLPAVIIWALFYILVCSVCFCISRYDLFGISAKSIYKSLSGQSLDMKMELREDGLYTENKCGSGLVGWNGILNIFQSDKSIFVYIGDYKAYIVPKRAFENNDVEIFFSEISKRIKKN